ncbi:hypothetical protein OE88DRAFT_82497 [Heliocybe sulcata]|uniref:Uncharacterized protein n=1 Tax=Heliocybe sulcata TaxID=5364 RepID=A0A5C3NI99_9AGAM|nr:hypothetical protein OE88DRAFT_82497 [Heliocybe sulcata]
MKDVASYGQEGEWPKAGKRDGMRGKLPNLEALSAFCRAATSSPGFPVIPVLCWLPGVCQDYWPRPAPSVCLRCASSIRWLLLVSVNDCGPGDRLHLLSLPRYMADDHRSTLARARKHRKLLVVANPNPDDLGSSSSDDNAQSSQTYTPQSYQYHPYYQPPVTSPSALSPPLDQQSNPSGSHKPHPLRTNLTENQPGYSHSRSNPTLSSPSSASSPAVESTPPPSTPGHSVEPVDLNGDNEQSTEPQIRTSSSSIDVPSTHSRNLYDRIKCVPQMVARSTRRGSSHKRPATSPTVSTSSQDTYMSPSSAIPGKVFVLVTTDSEHYSSVDISGRKDSAFIRERIYTSVRSTVVFI